ncbi:MAG: ABC transporter permease [Chloroflexota bacterium]|nr:ABC transporter permease [Chloroflexota bacterium]
MIPDIFAGLPPTTLALLLFVFTGGIVILIAAGAVSNPLLLRMGLRNMLRRSNQAMLLLVGVMLSTAVITASLGLPDSLRHAQVVERLTTMGNVDESVTGTFSQNQLNTVFARLRQDTNVQSVTGLLLATEDTTVTATRTGLSVFQIDRYGVPPNFDAVYGPITNVDGHALHFADLRPGEALISVTLAKHFAVRPGDTVQVRVGTAIITVTIQAILAHDLGVTNGEVNATPAIILPLVTDQQLQPGLPNTICLKNVGAGSMDDIGANGNRSRAVVRVLQQLFPGATLDEYLRPTSDFDSVQIHPLKPDVVNAPAVQLSKSVLFLAIGQEFIWLIPLYTCLLVGAGILLLVLLFTLLAAERRTEFGMSRAIGFQRHHLVQALLIEGCGYALVAALLGVAVGFGLLSLGMTIFSHLPEIDAAANNSASLPIPIFAGQLQPWLSWQSLLSAWCLGTLTTLITIFLASLWISRMTITQALRDLDNAPSQRVNLWRIMRTFWSPPQDADGQRVPETLARRVERLLETGGLFLWESWARGPLCLLVGGWLFVYFWDNAWLQQSALLLLLAGGSLLSGWLLTLCKLPAPLARRIGLSLFGLSWLVYGFQAGSFFRSLFQPYVGFPTHPSVLSVLLTLVAPILGAIVLVMVNADLLILGLSALLRQVHGLAPISRISLVYPLTFRFRSAMTVMLLGLVTFQVLLLILTNVGGLQADQIEARTGGFNLQVTMPRGIYRQLAPQMQRLQNHTLLAQDFTDVALLRFLHGLPEEGQQAPAEPVRLLLPGKPVYHMPYDIPQVADDIYLATTQEPMFVRAQGYETDQQIWEAVRAHLDYAVLGYDAYIAQLPTSNSFVPFEASIPENATPNAATQRVTIIGLLPAVGGQALYISSRTAAQIAPQTSLSRLYSYLFRLHAGISETQAIQDLTRLVGPEYAPNLPIASLDHPATDAIAEQLTLFLSGYLALGLLLGALAISLIISRSIIERRQQIGMLRALGFSRTLVQRAFLLEACFVIALGLLVGIALAFWQAYEIDRPLYQSLPIPLVPVVAILLGSALIAFMSTILPARKAAQLPPAEALRYE